MHAYLETHTRTWLADAAVALSVGRLVAASLVLTRRVCADAARLALPTCAERTDRISALFSQRQHIREAPDKSVRAQRDKFVRTRHRTSEHVTGPRHWPFPLTSVTETSVQTLQLDQSSQVTCHTQCPRLRPPYSPVHKLQSSA